METAQNEVKMQRNLPYEAIAFQGLSTRGHAFQQCIETLKIVKYQGLNDHIGGSKSVRLKVIQHGLKVT